MARPSVERSFSEPHIMLNCQCGWSGNDDEIEDWAVQPDRDRVVRQCPACGEPVPEWGALRSIDGVTQLARGPLRASLAEAGFSPE